MNAEFNWWLLIVGLVVGAGLVWLVIADWSRREEDIAADERATNPAWISQVFDERGARIDAAEASEVLEVHREYLRLSGVLDDVTEAPDVADEPDAATAAEPTGADGDRATDDGTDTWPTVADADGAGADDPKTREGADTWPAEADVAAPSTAAAAADDWPTDDQWPTHSPAAAASDAAPEPRASVRSAPISPRGARMTEPESEPPAP